MNQVPSFMRALPSATTMSLIATVELEPGVKNQEQRLNGSNDEIAETKVISLSSCVLCPSSTESPSSNESITLAAYIGNRLVGVGYPQQVGTTTEDAIFFLSIADGAEVASGQWAVGSGQEVSGQIRFVLLCNGEPVAHGTQTLTYEQDTVVGTLRKPYRITFHTIEDMQDKPYKILENQQIYIIRNENKYNILGVHY